MVNCNFNHNKRLDYIYNICENNYEKVFYAAIADTKIKENHIHSSYIYNNINDRR